jgi:hypothetical protein
MSQKFLSDVTLSTVTAGSMLKIDANGKIVGAVDGTDYISTSATAYWTASSGSGIYYSDDVRIGTYQTTIAPDAKLHVFDYQTTEPKLLIEDGNTGDASMQFKISTQSYTIGVDNSDSDKFVLSAGSVLGTGNLLEITSNGLAAFQDSVLIKGTLYVDNQEQIQQGATEKIATFQNLGTERGYFEVTDTGKGYFYADGFKTGATTVGFLKSDGTVESGSLSDFAAANHTHSSLSGTSNDLITITSTYQADQGEAVIQFNNGSTEIGRFDTGGYLHAIGFKTSTAATGFLKADGTVDTSTYVSSSHNHDSDYVSILGGYYDSDFAWDGTHDFQNVIKVSGASATTTNTTALFYGTGGIVEKRGLGTAAFAATTDFDAAGTAASEAGDVQDNLDSLSGSLGTAAYSATGDFAPAGTYADGTTYQTYGTGNNGWLMPDYNNNTSNFMRMYYDDGSREFRMYSNHGAASGEAKIALYDGGVFNTLSSTNISQFKTAYGWGNHASAGYATSLDLSSGLATKADTGHKYHSFSNGQQFYDGYGQNNYLRLFTENAVFDNFRFRGYREVEVSEDGVNWNPYSMNLDTVLDGREETGINITHETKKFRFTIDRSTGWPTTALFVIQTTWSNTSGHTGEVILETWDGSQWIQRDSWVYNGFQRGYNLHTTTQVHNGQNSMRVTILMDWDDASHNYVPLRRILLLSNYSGSVYDMKPFYWNYNRDVTFANQIYVSGGNSTDWNTAYGWGNHASQGYLTSVPSEYLTQTEGDARYLQSLPAHNHDTLYDAIGSADAVQTWVNEQNFATDAAISTAIGNLVDTAPAALNTLNELAAALGDDENFSTTVTNNIGAVNTRIDEEVFPAIPTNNNQLTNGAGYITSSGSITGNAATATSAGYVTNQGGQLLRHDNRTISPREIGAGYLQFGFTSFQNNNTGGWADFLHLRSYTDSSGGRDNLVMFSRSSIEMRIWQQDYDSTNPYEQFRDVAFKDEIPTNNNQLTNGAGYYSGTINLGSSDLVMQGSDPGDIVWKDASGTENHRIWAGSPNHLTYRNNAGTTYAIVHTGLSGYNASNWDTAYGWGNHASAGYASDEELGNLTTTVTGNTTQIASNRTAILDKLSLSGGTMTGALTVTNAATGILVNSSGHASMRLDRGSTSYDANLLFLTAGSLKWRMWMDGSDDYLYIRDEASGKNMLTFKRGAGIQAGNAFWANVNSDTVYNNYNENLRLPPAGNGVSVIAFRATGEGGVPSSSILGFSDRHEIRIGGDWKQRIYETGIYYSSQVHVDGQGNSGLWNTAYGWGNHASAGYASDEELGNLTTTVTGNTTEIANNRAAILDKLGLSGGTLTGTLTGTNAIFNSGAAYPLRTSSGQRYGIQVRNTANTVNANYGWWWFMDTNFNMGFHADGAADRFTLTRGGDLSISGDFKVSGSYTEVGNGIGSVTNDGNWNARLNVAGSSHARLDVKSVSDGIITSMFSHTGHGTGKVGTYSNHGLGLMVNGSEKVGINTSGHMYPNTDRTQWLGLETNRWQIVYCEILDSAGQHEKNLQNPEGEKSVGEYETGTVLVWKGGKNVPCTEPADHMRMGIAVKGIDSPLIQGAEPVLVTGSVNEGDYLVTSSVEGHAKAITPQFMRQHGLYDCVLGKALESAEGKSHLVKTWINI